MDSHITVVGNNDKRLMVFVKHIVGVREEEDGFTSIFTTSERLLAKNTFDEVINLINQK